MPEQRPLLGPDGEAAIARLMAGRPLLAFDFDGTLAPLVARPAEARLGRSVVRRLVALARRLPVAVISGRSLADLRKRLGFVPTYLVGNHGAEDAAAPGLATPLAERLAPLRKRLRAQQPQLAAAGVTVEDKGASLALHYRLALDHGAARQAIESVLAEVDPAWRVFGGKCVFNVVAAGSPDKAVALQALVARSGADTALFAGDDINDEPVFAAAPAHWLTVRVGRDDMGSAARFFIDSPAEMPYLLDRLRAHAQAAAPD